MLSYTFFLLFIIIGGVAIIGTGVANGNIKTGFPVVRDSDLEVEVVADGLYLPTNMRFVDNNTIIVTEQNGVIKNVDMLPSGKTDQKPILKVNSSKVAVENGLVGLAIMNNMSKPSNGNENGAKDLTNGSGYMKSANLGNVFLYFTEGNGDEARNRLYKYSFDGQNFRKESLLLDLPTNNLSIHNGGKIVIGRDGYLYTVIGDQYHRGKLQNVMNGSSADNTGVIFKIDPADGLAAPGNPFESNPSKQLSKYYAYGIRNSYGLAIDPVTGNLWDTENGDGLFDEINLVKPGFNSGWVKIMGPSSRPLNENVSADDDLVHFPGSNYSDPAFSWQQTIGVTDLEFLNSTKLGPEYNNTLFVGDFNTGSLFNFKLNSSRTGFTFNSTSLKDLVADNTKPDANSEITFGAGFSIITDIQTGPDGLLYILGYGTGSHTGVSGVIYRIQPTEKYDMS